jgi:hypothetical protein
LHITIHKTGIEIENLTSTSIPIFVKGKEYTIAGSSKTII